ncbi:hypothetical protein DY000_02021826 [Brassica cretica]|uniref:Uncharacterized protein n=1 Tax=Brassica cretica TaxID=69181 RepID=A0ABQ7EF82_BRACR|nr:hypothetical protein DY000_02021826 [Brassica cretica]
MDDSASRCVPLLWKGQGVVGDLGFLGLEDWSPEWSFTGKMRHEFQPEIDRRSDNNIERWVDTKIDRRSDNNIERRVDRKVDRHSATNNDRRHPAGSK